MNKYLLLFLYLLLCNAWANTLYAQQACPTLNGFLINSCADPLGVTQREGYNEMVVFHTGLYDYDLNNLTISWSSYDSGGGPLYAPTSGFCYTGCTTPTADNNFPPLPASTANVGFAVNPNRVAALNAIANCNPPLLASPTSNIIPADATVIVFSGGTCWPEPFADAYYDYNFSSLCGTGPIYVIFRNDCAGVGKIADDASGANSPRTISIDFGTANNGCASTTTCSDYSVNYSGDFSSPANNGSGVAVAGSGTTNGSVQNYACNPPGFIPSTNNGCAQAPPDISPIQICNFGNYAIPFSGVAPGATVQFYSASTGGTLLGSATANAFGAGTFNYNFQTTSSIWVQVTDNSPAGCSPSCRIEIPITQITAPTLSFTESVAPVCVGQPVVFTAQSNQPNPTYQWYIEDPTNTEITNILLPDPTVTSFSLTPTQSGFYFVYLELTSAPPSCQPVSYIDNLPVFVPPNASLQALTPGTNTPSTQVCPGGTLNLVANGGSNYVWSTGQTTSTISINSTGTYTVTVYSNDGCGDTETITITPISAPTATISGPTSVCAGGTAITLSTSTGGVGYQWAPAGAILSGQGTNSITTNTPTNYSVTVTGSGGCTASDTHTVSAGSAPTVSISGGTNVCSGGSLILTATGGLSSYQWTASNGGVIQGSSGGQSITATAAGTYTVVVSNTSGCTASASQVVSSQTGPSVGISGPQNLCPSGQITLTATAGLNGYQWQLNGSNISGQTSNTLNVTAPGSYTVVVSNVAGCTAVSLNYNVGLSSTPLPSISGPTSVCSGSNITLNGSGGTGYQWQLNGSNLAGQTAATLQVTGGGTYTVVVSNAAGCTATASQVVTQGTTPTPNITPPTTTTLCPGGSLNLNATGGVPGNTYQWQLNGSNIGGAAGSTYNAVAAGNYTVVITNGTCSATSAPLNIGTGNAPTPSINGPTSICSGSSLNLNASGGTSYQWQLNGSNIPNETNTTLSVNTAGNYSVIVSNASGCTATASQNIVAATPPTASITGPNGFCNGGSITLSAANGTTYQWQLNGSNIPNATNATLLVNTAGNYSVIVTNTANCTASASQNITAFTPTTTTISGPSTLCVGTPVNLSATAGNTTYQWQFNGSNISGATAATLSASNAGAYTVVVTDANACTVTSATYNLTSVTPPSAATNPPTSPLCNNNLPGNTLTLNLTTLVSGASSGTWQTNAPAGTLNGTIFNAEGLTAGNYNITYTVNGTPPCNSVSSTQSITVQNCPANCTGNATFNAPPAFCGISGQTLDLNTLFQPTTTPGGSWTTSAPANTISAGSIFNANGLDGNYNITYTAPAQAGCPPVTFTQQINIVAPPTANILAPGIPRCNTGSNTTLGLPPLVIGGTTGTWSCPEAPAAINGSSFNANGLNAGNYTLIYTVAAVAPCTGNATASQTLTVNEPQNTVLNQSTCANTYVLNAGVSGNGTWTNPGALSATIASPTAPTSNVTLNGGQGNYTFVWTPTTGSPCLNTVTVNLTYNTAGSNAGNDAIVCNNYYTLNGSSGNGTWTYSGPGTATFSNANSATSDVTISEYGSYIFTWTVSSGSCVGSDDVNIVFIPEATADSDPLDSTPLQECDNNVDLAAYVLSPGSTSIVLGDWASLVGSGGITLPASCNCHWTYTGPAGATATFSPNDTSPVTTVTVSQAGTYTFYWVCDCLPDFNNCGGNNSYNGITVVFNNPINANVTTACIDQTQFTANVSISGGQPPYTVNGNNIGNATTYSEVFPVGQQFNISISDNSICPDFAQGSLSPACGCPFVPEPVISSGLSPYCVDQSAPPQVSVQPFATYTYEWYLAGSATPLAVGNTFTPPGEGDYYVISVVADGCTSQPTNFTIDGFQTPPTPVLPPTATYCQGETAPILYTSTVGQLQWFDAGGNLVGSGTTFAPPTATIGTATYSLFEVSGSGLCVSGSADISITINGCSCPIINFISPNTAICAGEVAALVGSVDDPNNSLDHLEWINPSGQVIGTTTNQSSLTVNTSGSANGCSPTITNYTFRVFCTDDPTTPFAEQTVAVTVYPTPQGTIASPDGGCTVVITPNCPDFAVVGNNTYTGSGGAETHQFQLQNTAAAAAGAGNCLVNVPAAVNCPVANCPDISTITPNTDLCGGQSMTLAATVSNQPALLNMQWLDPTGAIISTTASVDLPPIPNTTCDPISYTYTLNVYCTSNPLTPSDVETVTITYYPTFTPSWLQFVPDANCALAPQLLPNGCAAYQSTQVNVEPAHPGLNNASWQITYNGGPGCIDTVYTYNYMCPSCFQVTTPSSGNLAVCAGNQPDFAALEANITINDPSASFGGWQWYTDPAHTNLATPADWQHQGSTCDVYSIILYPGGICNLPNANIVGGGQIILDIYPAFDNTWLVSTPGDCDLPQLTSNCANYTLAIDPLTLPAQPVVTSGLTTWNVTYNGSTCINQAVQVAYGCGATCPIATINQGAPLTACSGQSLQLSVNIFPATAINGTDYTLQWLLNGSPIAGETNTTLNVTLPSTDCDLLNASFSAQVTCLFPGGQPDQTVDAGSIEIHPAYNPANVNTTVGNCAPPTITACDNYNITPTNVPTTVEPGITGTATWTISSLAACFADQTATANYDCPGCPTITIIANEAINICDGTVLSNADWTSFETAQYLDPDGLFAGFQWYSDVQMTQVVTPNDYNIPSGCAVQDVVVYLGLLCANGTSIPAGTLTISVYPTPTSVAAVGGCSLEVQDNCGNTLTIQYLNGGVWTNIPPTDTPTNGQTAEWRAYVPGADLNGDGTPECFASGTVTAGSCNCTPPAAPTPIEVSLSACEGAVNTIPFEVSVPAGVFVVWYDENNLQVGVGTTLTPIDAGTYFAHPYNVSDTCEGPNIAATLTETESNTYFLTYGMLPFCLNAPNILPNIAGVATGTYTADNGLNIDANTGEIVLDAVGTFTITFTPDAVCDVGGTTTITVNDCYVCTPPTAPTLTTDTLAVCAGATNTNAFTAQTSGPNVGVYWYDAAGNWQASGNAFTPTTIGDYYAIAYNLDDTTCISGPVSLTLNTISTTAPIVTAGNDINVCEGTPINLSGNIVAGSGSVMWTSDGGTFDNAMNLECSFTPNTTGTIEAILSITSDECNLTTQDTVQITLQPTVVLSVSGDDAILSGESSQLNVSGGDNYTWTPASSLSCADCANPVATPTNTTTYTVTTDTDCAEPASFTVNVSEPPLVNGLILPNAFSPNNDNMNDIFRAVYNGQLTTYRLTIHNRWGQKVYETENVAEGWDGKFNGNHADIGVYVYYCTYQFEGDKEELLRGNVMLVR